MKFCLSGRNRFEFRFIDGIMSVMKNTITIWLIGILLAGWVVGCSSTKPNHYQQYHEQQIRAVADRIKKRESRSPENFQHTAIQLRDLLAGHPDQAQATAKRILEME